MKTDNWLLLLNNLNDGRLKFSVIDDKGVEIAFRSYQKIK